MTQEPAEGGGSRSGAPLKVVQDLPAHAPDHDATYMDRFLAVAMLNVYGFRGEMPRRVRADVAFAGMLVLIQAAIDLMAWFLGMRLIFVPGFGPVVGYPLALVFATLFAATIAIFERSVLVADVSLTGLLRNSAVWFRMGFVLLASLVTAVPLELFLYGEEIQKVIDKDRAAQVARAQDVLRGNIDGLIAALDGKLDKDLERLEAQYGPQRAYEPPTVSSVTPRIEALEKQIAGVMAAMQAEDEGRRSGTAGRGKRYRSLEGQLDTLNKQLTLLTTTHNDELKGLREEAQGRAQAGELAYQQAVTALRTTHEQERKALLAERADIETLPEQVLARRARVNIEVAEGFSARVKILHQMAEREPTVEWGVWALRLVMVLFGLLVLIQKATFSIETKAYFSATARAAVGDPRMRKLFGGLVKMRDMSSTQRENISAVIEDGQDQVRRG
ncbi:MAG: DUF4407 domain-containing protein [Myxococcota bacterium]